MIGAIRSAAGLLAAVLVSTLLASPVVIAKESYVVRYADVLPPEHPGNIAMKEFKKNIEKLTDGQIKFRAFQGGQLYTSERAIIEAVINGDIEMGYTGSPVLTNFTPIFSVITLPFLFQSNDEAYAILDGKLKGRLDAAMEKINLVDLGYSGYGFRHFFTKKPIHTPDDFKGVKMRVIENPLYQDMFTAFGAVATPYPFGEVYTALQQGTFDAVDSEITTGVSAGFDKVLSHFTYSGHTFMASTIFMNKKFFDHLPADLQAKLRQAGTEESMHQRDIAASQEKKLLEQMRGHVTIASLTDAERDQFKEKVNFLYDRYKSDIGEDTVDLVKQEIADYRSKQ